jgi:hypothetical protein
MSWYNDADATQFGEYLTAKYTTDLGRDSVDVLGWVRWTMDWSDLRGKGTSQAKAVSMINERINAIVGLPAAQWPAGWEPTAVPFL